MHRIQDNEYANHRHHCSKKRVLTRAPNLLISLVRGGTRRKEATAESGLIIVMPLWRRCRDDLELTIVGPERSIEARILVSLARAFGKKICGGQMSTITGVILED